LNILDHAGISDFFTFQNVAAKSLLSAKYSHFTKVVFHIHLPSHLYTVIGLLAVSPEATGASVRGFSVVLVVLSVLTSLTLTGLNFPDFCNIFLTLAFTGFIGSAVLTIGAFSATSLFSHTWSNAC
jgi:hypothetical protein